MSELRGVPVSDLALPDCWRCRNFAMTWQPATPYLCRFMGFKSRLLPSIEVARADGRPCAGFSPKSVPPHG